jgi:hypothetical protein
LQDARRRTLQTAPKLQQLRPKRRRPITWLPSMGASKPAPMISSNLRLSTSSSLRRQGGPRITGITPMTATTMTTPTTTVSMGATASQCSGHKRPRRRCRNTRSPNAPAMAIYGRPDIGAMLPRATTGFPAPGHSRLKWATSGPPDIGEITVAGIVITTARGVNMSATTAALTMDSAIAAPATRAGTGAADASTITATSTM